MIDMIEMLLVNEKQMLHLGTALAPHLRAGDVLLLRGDVGAGKTVLARGIARGLGIKEPITSPTFTLLHTYEDGRLPFTHFDLYRLTGEDDFYDAGLSEYLGGTAVSVVEWPQCCEGAMPSAHLDIHIQYGEETGTRILRITAKGSFREVKWDEIISD